MALLDSPRVSVSIRDQEVSSVNCSNVIFKEIKLKKIERVGRDASDSCIENFSSNALVHPSEGKKRSSISLHKDVA